MAKSTSTSAGRVNKRAGSRSPRVTRSRSAAGARMSASASGGGGVLERMVEEAGGSGRGGEEVGEGMDCESDGGVPLGGAEEVEVEQAYEGKGKGKLAALPDDDGKEEVEEVVKEEKPFRLFDLPTEIRLEIYRACLTRPYNILLSKVEKPAPPAEKSEEDEENELFEEILANPRPGWTQSTVASQSRQPTQSGFAARRGAGRGAARAALRAASSSSSSVPSAPASGNASTTVVVGDTPRKPTTKPANPAPPPVTQSDPLLVNLLRASKTVYKEARDVLYAENLFTLNIFTAVPTLACLHQRSRRRIKHIELEIPTYTEILESFSETVRLSLRYCFGLRRLVIHTPFTLPGGEGSGPSGGNTTVYANGFDILRWLPQGCEVVVEGTRNREIDVVVGRHMQLAGVQDKVSPFAPFLLWFCGSFSVFIPVLGSFAYVSGLCCSSPTPADN